MFQQNELITFLVGTGVLLFVLSNRNRIMSIPGAAWLVLSYTALYSGWIFTLVEGFMFPRIMNTVEHASYMVSSLSAAVWSWRFLFKGEGTR